MITAIIAAAGNGSRAAQQQNKVLFVMPDGKTVLEHAVKPFVSDERITEIIVTVAETDEKIFGEILKDYPVKIIRGGKTLAGNNFTAFAPARTAVKISVGVIMPGITVKPSFTQ